MRTMTVEVVCCSSPASSKILVIDKFVLPAQILEIVQVVDAAVDDGDADAVSVQAVYVPSYGSAHCGSYIVQRSIHRAVRTNVRSEEHTSELQSRLHLVCRLLLDKK